MVRHANPRPCPAAEPPPVPAEFWLSTPALVEALAAGAMGAVLRAYRQHPAHTRRITQAELADWLGITQCQLSRIERGLSAASDLVKLRRWSDAIGLPPDLRWFQASAPTDADRTRGRASAGDYREDPSVHRRDLLRLASFAAVGGAVSAPWDRLAHALRSPMGLDATAVSILESRTVTLFREEELAPARAVRDAALDHAAVLRHLVANGPSGRLGDRLVRLVGETEAIAGWLAFDLGQHGPAQRHLLAAVAAAEQVGDPPLRACALGYLSYMAEAQGDPDEALRLLDQAERDATAPASAATRSWLTARAAEVAAGLGEREHAVRALERSYVAFDYATPRAERAWTGFYDHARQGSLAVSTYIRLRHPLLDTTARSVIGSLAPSQEKVAAIINADLATAAAASGDFDRAEQLAADAVSITLRTEAGLAKTRLRELGTRLAGRRDQSTLRIREQLAVLA